MHFSQHHWDIISSKILKQIIHSHTEPHHDRNDIWFRWFRMVLYWLCPNTITITRYICHSTLRYISIIYTLHCIFIIDLLHPDYPFKFFFSGWFVSYCCWRCYMCLICWFAAIFTPSLFRENVHGRNKTKFFQFIWWEGRREKNP